MELRVASDEDLGEILTIARTTAWDKAEYLKRQSAGGNVVAARSQTEVAGFVVWNREFFSLAFIWLVVVAPRHRRQGVAGKLFDEVESRCVGERVFTSTNASHVTMQTFLERRGYRKAGEVDVDAGDPEWFYEFPGNKRG